MSRTINIKVVNNRILFRCPSCRARRNMAVLPGLRQKLITCHKCQSKARCLLNRRNKPRENQVGKVLLINNEDKEAEITLHDISIDGAGFDLPHGIHKTFRIAVGSKVRFRCTWNPRLFSSSYYEVRSIIGQRVGVKKV